jgi:hypothetical protein
MKLLFELYKIKTEEDLGNLMKKKHIWNELRELIEY